MSWFFHKLLYFLKDFGKEISLPKSLRKYSNLWKNQLNSNPYNFWTKSRLDLVDGAKRIYFIQRIHWKNFQVWVLIIRTHPGGTSRCMWNPKNGQNFEFQDEFRGGSAYQNSSQWSTIESLMSQNMFYNIVYLIFPYKPYFDNPQILPIFHLWNLWNSRFRRY